MGALTYEPGYLPGPASFCTALPNSTGSTAAMTWAGTTSIAANDLILGASGMPIGNTGVFIASPDAVELPLGDGNLCLGSSTLGFVLRLQPSFVASRTGTADLSLDHDTPPTPEAQVVAGSTWFYQAWFRDLVPGGSGFNFSEGLRVTYCP